MSTTTSASSAATVLTVEDLTFSYEPGEKQVSSVRFDLRAGRTFGVLGGNECDDGGLPLIMANLSAVSGTIQLFGEECA